MNISDSLTFFIFLAFRWCITACLRDYRRYCDSMDSPDDGHADDDTEEEFHMSFPLKIDLELRIILILENILHFDRLTIHEGIQRDI